MHHHAHLAHEEKLFHCIAGVCSQQNTVKRSNCLLFERQNVDGHGESMLMRLSLQGHFDGHSQSPKRCY